MPRPSRFTYRKDSVPIVQEAGLAPGSVWKGAENLAPTGFQSLDLPAQGKSLYQLQIFDAVGECKIGDSHNLQ
jgi:hypothetical protein